MNSSFDINRWSIFGLSTETLDALKTMGFTCPTQIQELVIPPACSGQKDVIGAAETGSGKTLAFGIPILERWLKYYSNDEPTTSDDIKSLFALIIVPTRELAIQVSKEIKKLSSQTNKPKLNSITLVGGLSQQKQQRLLKRNPDVIVATPGRLWSLINEGNEYLSELGQLKMLVIDEIDRMIEKGHFEELNYIIDHIHSAREEKDYQLQTLVFSATVVSIASKWSKDLLNNSSQMIQKLIQIVRIRSNKCFIADLTKNKVIPEALLECRMNCLNLLEKDSNLYYMLNRYGGRTLVFGNSIDAIRRVYSILNKLQFKPSPLLLHAKMEEKKRLKNLEKFAEIKNSVLLATDLAARGLDIKMVENVIHYQVSRTPEHYIHRSGRTARAHNSGLSVLFVDPTDVHLYKKICKNMNKDKDLEVLSVDSKKLMGSCVERVSLASELESLEFVTRKKKSKENWFKRMAKEADILLDDDSDRSNDESDRSCNENLKARRRLEFIQSSLNRLLSQPLAKPPMHITQPNAIKLKNKAPVIEDKFIRKEETRKRYRLESSRYKLYKKQKAMV